MSKRRYTNMVALLPVIESMLAAGMGHREIEDELGQGDRAVHNHLKRQRRKAAEGMPKKLEWRR